MARKGSWNPIAFVPLQVSLISSAVYIALFAFLIYNHHAVPSAPTDPVPVEGLNLTQAWLDLSYISDGFHPIDSRRNEAVRKYILERVEGILEDNGVEWKLMRERVGQKKKGKKGKEEGSKAVTVFQDDRSNVTFVDDWHKMPWTCYQESSNAMVYIRGENDKQDDWWEDEERYDGDWGVLVRKDGMPMVFLELLSDRRTFFRLDERSLRLCLFWVRRHRRWCRRSDAAPAHILLHEGRQPAKTRHRCAL